MKKTLALILALMLCICALPARAHALTYDYSAVYDPETVWDFLMDWLQNEYGVAALMGNLYRESGLNPVNAANWFNGSSGMSDIEYTEAVDNGSYGNFVDDGVAYGIAQWTYWSRKQALYDYAQDRDSSVGNLETQLEYLKAELLDGYEWLINDYVLCATDVEEPSEMILRYYERPGNYSDEAIEFRASAGRDFYDKFAKGDTVQEPVQSEPDPEVNEGSSGGNDADPAADDPAPEDTPDLNEQPVIPGGTAVRGDVNCDGIVDANDLTLLARYVSMIEETDDQQSLSASDVDANGTIDANDLTILARYVACIISEL